MDINTDLLWQPLLEASAQTIVGAIGGFAVTKIITKISEKNVYVGAMDFWKRGIINKQIQEGDNIIFDGLISPYFQLFPDNPYNNATRWNRLYNFEGKINKEQYQAMEFYAGSDAALRTGSLNGESLIGLYNRYGFIGEGIIGIASTSYLLKEIKDFFSPDFYGIRAKIYGKLSRCPAQHGFIAQTIARNSGIDLPISDYRNLYHIHIHKIKLPNNANDRICSLLGSPWAVTSVKNDQYLVQYGYVSDPIERKDCINHIMNSKTWHNACVFFDDIISPSHDLSFKYKYIY